MALHKEMKELLDVANDWEAKNTTLQNELEAMRRDKVASDSETAVYGTKHSQYSPKSTLN